MACNRCPCPITCLRWPAFCGWAAADPPDPVQLAHICGRSAMGAAPMPVAAGRAGVAESLALLAAAKACPFRSTAGCGCGGQARCALKGGVKVFLPDCFGCLGAYPG